MRVGAAPEVMAAFSLISLLAVCASFCFASEPVGDRIVVLISVDGLTHYYMDDPN